MSIGFWSRRTRPMIWRGPMVTSALQQLLNETQWRDLDYLVIDLPPGTGDIQLTLCQKSRSAAAFIVTTPQDIATARCAQGGEDVPKVDVPVLGIVENMSTHICSNCGHEEPIFGRAAAPAWPSSTASTCWASCRWTSASARRRRQRPAHRGHAPDSPIPVPTAEIARNGRRQACHARQP
jgi:ATP-binding protein involved in chromosome partitioning